MSEGTGHAGACYAEDIGFEVRDCILVADSPTDKLHYVPKASKKEREQGLEDFEPTVVTSSDSQEDETEGDEKNSAKKRKNTHPTVKAVKVMERLLMDIPEGSIVLDPFAGSGTTGVAASGKFNFVGIEKEQEYFDIAKARIAASAQKDDKNEGNST
jgi:DNA modification methylase